MPEDNHYLNLEGTYMPRHPHDIMNTSKEVLFSIETIGKNLFDTATKKYEDPSNRWVEMDKFWAGQQAKFMIRSTPYILFIPGKYYTYSTLADVVENAFVEIKTPLRGAKIAEIGSGSAVWSLLLGQRGAKPYLFDKSWCALQFAQFLADKNYLDVELSKIIQGDFYHLPKEWKEGGGIFDAVVSGAVLEHLGTEDQNRYLREVFIILKPGGLVAFTMPNPKSPLNIDSDKRKEQMYNQIKALADRYRPGDEEYQYTIDFPMPYNKEGGLRSMDSMLRENGFIIQKTGDAVLVAPSAPLQRKLIEGNKVAEEFYGKVEMMCKPGFINRKCPTGEDVEACNGLITFWKTQSAGLTDMQRSQIGRWLYIIGRKPRGGG